MPQPWPLSARDALVTLLGAGRAALPVWESLDQADLIVRLIPEWEVVRSAPQHNPVHLYTVDRHLVEAAAAAAARTRNVSRPDLLLVGALLHDIGKGQPGDHSEVGVEIVSSLAPRLGFDQADTEVLVELVRYHLLLPEIATRRDLSDPATSQMVAAAVGSVPVLELLDNLTRADAAATGPAAWSDWKASLVSELVLRTRDLLSGGPTVTTPEVSDRDRELAAMPGVTVHIEAEVDGVTSLVVVADDTVGLLGQIAGVFAINRLTVRSARTRTIDGRAVTVWAVQPEFGEPPSAGLLREELRRSISGSLNVTNVLKARAVAHRNAQAPPRAPATFDCVSDGSEFASVVEVRAHDGPGLLYVAARALSEAGFSISAAHVATLGADVVDVFYVSFEGRPLTESELTLCRDAVLDALAEFGE